MTDDKTLMVLKSERARQPELAETLDLHIALLEARRELQITNDQLQIQPGEAHSRLEHGEPMLRADEIALDWDAFARLCKTICHIAARHRPADAEEFAQLAMLCDQPAHGEEMAREYLEATQHASSFGFAQDRRITEHASRGTHQSPLLAFVLNNALHPFLSAAAQQLQKFVDDASWYRAFCPICGGEPDFSALEKESGARRLLCARCDYEWTFHRATCPFCGEDTPGKLGYFPGGDGAYRLYTCENCKRYLKTIDLRELAREVNLPAERVLTIAMDAAAGQAGYRGA